MNKRNRLPRKPGPFRGDRPRRDPGPAGKSDRPTRADPGGADGHPESGGAYWIYGSHAVRAALANPRRRFQRLVLTDSDPAQTSEILGIPEHRLSTLQVRPETVERTEIARLLPDGAVHQGLAARVAPLPAIPIEDLLETIGERADAWMLVLDQVTDPHNVGAILRSAAAFGAAGVILTERNAPPETGALAKAASGALEIVPLVRVTNLARALDQLGKAGFWSAGLAADGPQTLAEARLSGRIALVLGSEGEGLRRLTRERCDFLVRLPTSGPIDHLNVSNAAAVALYELARDRTGTATAAAALSGGSDPAPS